MQRHYKDVLTYEKNFKIIFNDKVYFVFYERLMNCCRKFCLKFNSSSSSSYSHSNYHTNSQFYPYSYDNDIFCDSNNNNNNSNEENWNKDKEERIKGMIEIKDKDISGETFSTFIDCINGEEIMMNEENTSGLMILGLEFGFERLIKECEEYIETEERNNKEFIKKYIKEHIQNIKKRSKDNLKDKLKRKEEIKIKEKDQNEFERIIRKYFNIVIEEEKQIEEIPLEILNRIINHADFSLKENNKSKFIDLVIYQLKKEGQIASILMSNMNIRNFSNSDIEKLMEEKAFITASLKTSKEDIIEMIETRMKMKKIEIEMKEMKEYIEKKEEETKKKEEEEVKKNKDKKEKRKQKDQTLQIEIETIQEEIRRMKENNEMKELKELKELKEELRKEMKYNLDKERKEREIGNEQLKIEILKKFDEIEKNEQKKRKELNELNEIEMKNLKILIMKMKAEVIEDMNKVKIENEKNESIFDYLTKTCQGNPHIKGIINITSNGDEHHHCYQTIDNNFDDYFYPHPIEKSFIQFDFKNKKISLTNYSLESRGISCNKLINWEVVGSNDGVNWKQIDERHIPEWSGNYNKGTYDNKNTDYYQMIKIQLKGKSSSSQNYLIISHIEFFGKIISI